VDQQNQSVVASVNVTVCEKQREDFSPSGRRPVANNSTRQPNKSLCFASSRPFLLTAILLITTLSAFAQEQSDGKKVAIGLGAEFNFNSRENFAGGAALGFDVDLPYSLATGANVAVSYNFDIIVVLEPTALFRWYFLGVKEQKHSGLFVQADAGAYLVLEEEELIPLFSGGLRVGLRVPLKSFYIEPYGRFGSPYIFGVGLSAGVKF